MKMNLKNHDIKIDLSVGEKDHAIFFKTGDKKLSLNPESLITLTLLPSMKIGKPLIIPEQADPQLLSSLNQIQDIFSTWEKDFSRVSIDTMPINGERDGGGVATFFTGGVDSFYTLLKHKDEISHLIYVHGFEIREMVSSEIKSIADRFNKEVIEVETNLRDFSDPIVSWKYYQGSALATIGHLLRSNLKKIYIPSTHTYSDLFPWGSHPLVDPLWSSSGLQFVHDGCEATRVEKLKLISKYKKALNSLRVCLKNTGSKNNCANCEKCVRTMINLEAIDALKKSSTFPNTLLPRRVARLAVSDENTKAFVRENLDYLSTRDDKKMLQWALRWVLIKPRFVIKLRNLARLARNTIRNRSSKK